MARAKHCNWKGTAARGVYKPSCAEGASVMGIPPMPGKPCPNCNRPVVHYRPKQKTATMADYLKWKKRRAVTVGGES